MTQCQSEISFHIAHETGGEHWEGGEAKLTEANEEKARLSSYARQGFHARPPAHLAEARLIPTFVLKRVW
jgi:hypothetical protein